jgi:hypothetical protein
MAVATHLAVSKKLRRTNAIALIACAMLLLSLLLQGDTFTVTLYLILIIVVYVLASGLLALGRRLSRRKAGEQ